MFEVFELFAGLSSFSSGGGSAVYTDSEPASKWWAERKAKVEKENDNRRILGSIGVGVKGLVKIGCAVPAALVAIPAGGIYALGGLYVLGKSAVQGTYGGITGNKESLTRAKNNLNAGWKTFKTGLLAPIMVPVSLALEGIYNLSGNNSVHGVLPVLAHQRHLREKNKHLNDAPMTAKATAVGKVVSINGQPVYTAPVQQANKPVKGVVQIPPTEQLNQKLEQSLKSTTDYAEAKQRYETAMKSTPAENKFKAIEVQALEGGMKLITYQDPRAGREGKDFQVTYLIDAKGKIVDAEYGNKASCVNPPVAKDPSGFVVQKVEGKTVTSMVDQGTGTIPKPEVTIECIRVRSNLIRNAPGTSMGTNSARNPSTMSTQVAQK